MDFTDGYNLSSKEFIQDRNLFKWQSKVLKGNSSGAGWIVVPKKYLSLIKYDKYYQIYVLMPDQNMLKVIKRFSKTKGITGIYLPAKFCLDTELHGKIVEVLIESSEYFNCTKSRNNQVRLPNYIVKKFQIQEKEVYSFDIIQNDKHFTEISLIHLIKRSRLERKSNEFYFNLTKNGNNEKSKIEIKIIKKIERIISHEKVNSLNEISISNLIKDSIVGIKDENTIIIFLGRNKPLITPIIIPFDVIDHYFGCFYADGTKVGSGFRINASTPEQAIYYCSILKNLIFNMELNFDLTYTVKPNDKRNDEVIKSNIIDYWKKKSGINISSKRVHLIKSKSSKMGKWNKFGSLAIRENKALVNIFHREILKLITNSILLNNNCEFKWRFLFGILEGDGFVSGGEKRIGIGISCHGDDVIIKTLLNQLEVEYKIDNFKIKSGISNSFNIIIHLKEILKHFEIVKKNIFIYYPKRRNTFFKRLLNKPIIQSIIKGDFNQSYIKRSLLLGSKIDIKKLD